MGVSHVNQRGFNAQHDKFERYAAGLKSSLGPNVNVKKRGKYTQEAKEVKVSKAISQLIKAYNKLSRYENLKGSSASKTLNEILANKNLQKQFPKKRLLFKLEKFFIDFFNKYYFARGRLKHPENFPKNEISPNVFFERLGIKASSFKLHEQNYTFEGKADLNSAVLLLDITDPRGDGMQAEVSVEDAFAVIKNRKDNEVHVRIPLEQLTGEIVLEKLLKQFSQDGSYTNSQKLLDKLGVTQSEYKTNQNGLEYTLKKAEDSDSLLLTVGDAVGNQKAFSLTIDQSNQALLRKISDGKPGKVVYIFTTGAHGLDLETLLARASLRAGLEIPMPRDLSDNLAQLRNTRMIRGLGSIKMKKEKILQKAIEMNLDPDRKVKDYPRETIREFLDFLSTAPLHYTADHTIEELIHIVHASKLESLPNKEGFQAMNFLLDQLQHTTRRGFQNRQFLETYKSRIQDQLALLKEREILWDISEPEEALNFAAKVANGILKKVDSPDYKKIGVLLQAGWNEVDGGHYINVEVIKIGDKYSFRVANAGAGVFSNHRRVFDWQRRKFDTKKAITIKQYETSDPAEAQKIIRDLLYLNTRVQGDSAAKDFYACFKNTTSVEDYAIPGRVIQTTANCVLRDQQETFFDVCQRHGKVNLANSFLKTMEVNLKSAVHDFPALAEELELKGAKPKIEPLRPGKSRLVLQGTNSKDRHLLPKGRSNEYSHTLSIGSKADITLSNVKHLAPQQASLSNINGKLYLCRHWKCPAKHQVAILRGGEKIPVENAVVKLKKGDQILLEDQLFTLS